MKILSLGEASSSHIRDRVEAFQRFGHSVQMISNSSATLNNVDIIYCWKNNPSKNKVKGFLIFLYNIFRTIKLMKTASCDICHAYYATNILSILAAIFLKKPLVIDPV